MSVENKTSKPCSKCGATKQLSEFHASSKASDGKSSWCKTRANGMARAARKRLYSKESKRKWQLKTRYNLTPEQVNELLENQGGKCAICDYGLIKHHIDHCHNTGSVRGILCHQCNIRLGGWDDISWRDRAMAYLGIGGSVTATGFKP